MTNLKLCTYLFCFSVLLHCYVSQWQKEEQNQECKWWWDQVLNALFSIVNKENCILTQFNKL